MRRCCRSREAPDARDHRAAGRPLHAHLHRPRPALDGRLQLHRVRAPRRAPRSEPVQLRAVGYPLRRDLRIRRNRLDPRGDGVRAAVHALQLSIRGSRHRRRGMGNEGRRGGGVHMRAVAHLALCGRARAQPAVRAVRRRREPAGRHLHDGRRAQRLPDDRADDGRRAADDRDAAGTSGSRRGAPRAACAGGDRRRVAKHGRAPRSLRARS